MTSALTIEQVKQVLPEKAKVSINQQMVDKINTCISDPEEAQIYRDNLIGYAHIVADGKFKVEQYFDAVRYVSYKIMGSTNIEAYAKTFPDKMKDYAQRNLEKKHINAYVTSYNKGKLVNLILEQTLIPAHVLNQDIYQKAINTQAELMISAKSEKVRTDAANSILNHLKPPEASKIELDIGQKTVSLVNDLKETLGNLAAKQKNLIDNKQITTKEVAHSRIIPGEYEEVND